MSHPCSYEIKGHYGSEKHAHARAYREKEQKDKNVSHFATSSLKCYPKNN
jgi:hypothetical protein